MKTAECVSPNHPDKICDRISDAILDECLSQDPYSRVAIETQGGHGKISIMGELTTNAEIDIKEIALKVVNESFIADQAPTEKEYDVAINVVKQSREIANGVDIGGAGDQGIMVGYACNDNEEMVPQEYYLARSLCQFIFERHPYDGKTQVTLNDKGSIETIVASFQNVPKSVLHDEVTTWMAKNIDGEDLIDFNIYANPAGDWNQGGFDADTGLTGRKLMVDNYGPQIAIGGGAFSGKDATKVDRSGAYMARRIAVDILKSNNAKRVMVKIAYAIGRAEPVMIDIVAIKEDGEILDSGWDLSKYDLTPNGIIETLHLREPQFESTAEWGHFGHSRNWDN